MKNTHLLLTGGGTLGPVTPLLAIADEWKKKYPEAQITFVGTPKGPEKELVEGKLIPYIALSSPKFDRTRLWKLPLVLPHLLLSCIRAWQILGEVGPGAVVSAGAYVSVPVAWMAWLRRIPVFTHQLDVVPLLANKLMARFAKKITVTWEESAKHFPARKTEVVGAMARAVLQRGEASLARDRYGFDPQLPTVLVMGGGTGAATINEMMAVIGPELVKRANVLHLTGKGKLLPELEQIGQNYKAVEFLAESIADAYALADIVVARAGMGTIAEVVALKKPTVLVPLQSKYQEKNAEALEGRHAALVVHHLTPQTLSQAIFKVLQDEHLRQTLSANIGYTFPLTADKKIVEIIDGNLSP